MTEIDCVDEWLPLPDLADRMGIEFGPVRQLVRDRKVVGVKHGPRGIFCVPALFLVPAVSANPANILPQDEVGGPHAPEVVVSSLPGTITLLTDMGLSDAEIIRWLFEVDPSLGCQPIDALRQGRKSEVRRTAQVLA